MRLIDADALIERLEPYKDKYDTDEFPYFMVHDAFIYEIEKEPTVETDMSEYSDRLYKLAYERGKAEAVPVRHGRWIKLDIHANLADHKCTACGQECYVPTCMGDPMYTYCPNCGARMVEE